MKELKTQKCYLNLLTSASDWTYGGRVYKPFTQARQSPSPGKNPIQGIKKRGNPQQGRWSNKKITDKYMKAKRDMFNIPLRY